jgi:hypothetical protein
MVESLVREDGVIRWSRVLIAIGFLALFAGIVAVSLIGGGTGSPGASSDQAPSGVDAPIEAANDTDDGSGGPDEGAGLANDTDDRDGGDDGEPNDSAGDGGDASVPDDSEDPNAPEDGTQPDDRTGDDPANDGNDAPTSEDADSDQNSRDADGDDGSGTAADDGSGNGDGAPTYGDGNAPDDGDETNGDDGGSAGDGGDGSAEDGTENDNENGGDDDGDTGDDSEDGSDDGGDATDDENGADDDDETGDDGEDGSDDRGDASDDDDTNDDEGSDAGSGDDGTDDSDSSSAPGPVTVEECRPIDQPGTYELAQDFDSSNVQSIDLGNGIVRPTCIAVQSSDVVLDGGGAVVSGSEEYLSVGVHVYDPAGSAVQNVTVRNLQVEDWSNGVQVGVDTWAVTPAGPATARIENVQSNGNENHGFFVVGSGVELSSVMANDNDGAGLGVFDSSDVLVNGATTTGNGEHGVGLFEGVFDSTFTQVETTNNGGAEIYLGQVTAGNEFSDIIFGGEDDSVEGYDARDNTIGHPIVEDGNEDESDESDGGASDDDGASDDESADEPAGDDESGDSVDEDDDGDDGESDAETDEQDEESGEDSDDESDEDDGSDDEDGEDTDDESDDDESDEDSEEQGDDSSDDSDEGADESGSAPASGSRTIDECTTIDEPGTYELPGNVQGANGIPVDLGNGIVRPVCIAIQSADVVLEGNGATIAGSDAYLSVGVHVYDPAGSSVQNVTVRNLRVEDWSNGVQVGVDTWAVNPAGPATASIENVQSNDNEHHGFFVVGSGTQLTSVVANDNGASGIGVFESSDVQVTGATTTGNADHGLGLLDGVFDSSFTQVETTNNDGAEIYFGEVTAGNVFSDTTFGGEDDSVEGYDGTENTIEDDSIPGEGSADEEEQTNDTAETNQTGSENGTDDGEESTETDSDSEDGTIEQSGDTNETDGTDSDAGTNDTSDSSADSGNETVSSTTDWTQNDSDGDASDADDSGVTDDADSDDDDRSEPSPDGDAGTNQTEADDSGNESSVDRIVASL